MLRGGGGGTTYILQADTNRWASSLPNCPAGWENREDRHFQPLPSLQDATLRYRDKFPRIARAFSPFSPSFRRISTRIYISQEEGWSEATFFSRREKILEGVSIFLRDAPFLFQKESASTRTVAVGPRVRFACNRIAMLILSLLRGYVERGEAGGAGGREREREEGTCVSRTYLLSGDEFEFQFQLPASRVSVSSPNTLYRELRCCRGVVAGSLPLSPKRHRRRFVPSWPGQARPGQARPGSARCLRAAALSDLFLEWTTNRGTVGLIITGNGQ